MFEEPLSGGDIAIYKLRLDSTSLIAKFEAITVFQDETILIERGLFPRKEFVSLVDGSTFYITETDWYTNKTTIYKRCSMESLTTTSFQHEKVIALLDMKLSFKGATVIYKWEFTDTNQSLLDIEHNLRIEEDYKRYLASLPPRDERINTRREQQPRRRAPST